MFVKDWMQTNLITVNEDDTILDAVHLMRENRIRRLPVLKKGKLTGIITEKDIKEFSPSRASTLDIYEMHNILAKSVVKDAMTSDVISVSPENPIERAALILRDKRFGGLPVVDSDGELCGIITSVDVFDVFVEAMGMRKAGARITIFVEDQPGAIAEIAKTIKKHNLNIISLATFYFKNKPEGFRDIVIRLSGNENEVQSASDELHENGFEVTSLLFLDAANIVK
ncbi:CBS and ACT domain-containing protein [Flexistipes sp.]|uniref:CBS and ACT domain-containing protein n=1 Tax=Flexistipes sp. TaxID=3088135 RepID=UPI002E21D2FB|nr:CBS and ACT domain-containing protein [Flexistipes sp.]